MEYPTNILALDYYVTQPQVQLTPASALADERMKVYSMEACLIPAKLQKVVLTDIILAILTGYLASIYDVANLSPRKPLVCPGVLDPAYVGELFLSVGNLKNGPLLLDPNLFIAYVQLL